MMRRLTSRLGPPTSSIVSYRCMSHLLCVSGHHHHNVPASNTQTETETQRQRQTLTQTNTTTKRHYVSFGDDDDEISEDILKTMIKSQKYPTSKQIKGRYVSPWTAETKKTMWDIAKLLMSPVQPRIQFPNNIDSISLIPQLQVDMESIRSTAAPHLTWMGHASCYYQTDGVYFLTDPVWGERASPISIAGPKRFTTTPVDVANIKIDIVLLSHTHYDHMDVPTIRTIGNRALWIVPLGVKKQLNRMGINNVIELDWWGSYHHLTAKGKNIEIVFTPTKHWTSRTPFDRNTCLWGSFVVLGSQARFFFTGDSAYCSVFKTVGEHYGPFDIAAIPIGAYTPRWFMKDVHCTPEEAVKIHKDLRAKRSCGIHWGTFPMTGEDPVEPAFELARIRNLLKMEKDEFFTMGIGETMRLNDKPRHDLATLHDDYYGHYLQSLRHAPIGKEEA